MLRVIRNFALAAAFLASPALADSTSYAPHATGFTLPNAQQAVTATSAVTANYATTAGSTGYATNAGTATTATNATYANSAGSAVTATSATNATNASYAASANVANSAAYATNSGIASQAAELTAGNNCPAGTALSVTNGILGCVSSVTSITGQLDGAQVVGNLSNVGSITASGGITATGGNIVANSGYVYGVTGLFTNGAVYASTYADRNGGATANFLGNASTASYAASSVVGVLYQTGAGDGSTYYCGSGYYAKFYDTNVNSTNNAFFYQCVQNGH